MLLLFPLRLPGLSSSIELLPSSPSSWPLLGLLFSFLLGLFSFPLRLPPPAELLLLKIYKIHIFNKKKTKKIKKGQNSKTTVYQNHHKKKKKFGGANNIACYLFLLLPFAGDLLLLLPSNSLPPLRSSPRTPSTFSIISPRLIFRPIKKEDASRYRFNGIFFWVSEKKNEIIF